jgi:hypothetical protein
MIREILIPVSNNFFGEYLFVAIPSATSLEIELLSEKPDILTNNNNVG